MTAMAETAAAGSSTLRSLFASAKAVVNIILMVGLIGSWFVFLRPQFLGGPAAYVLVSGQSMEPALHHNDFVIVRQQNAYSKGDIVVYRIPESDAAGGAIVIHRIIGGSAERGYLLQGDNRSTPDRWRPKSTDVVGRLMVAMPGAGRFLPYLRSPLIVAAFAGYMAFLTVYLGGRKPEPSDEAGAASN